MSSFPQQLAYSGALKPAGVKARMNRTEFLPLSAGTFSPAGARIITIPVSSQMFLDTSRSFVTLNVSATVATQPAYLRSGYSLFSRLRVLNSGGQVLEDIQNFGLWANRYIDMLVPPSQRGGQLTASGFASNQNGVWRDPAGSTVQGALTTDNMMAFPAGATTSFDLVIPLALSGILNMTSARHGDAGQGLYLPLGITNGGIQIELTLRDSFYDCLEGVATTSITALSVTNVKYSAMLLDFGPEVLMNLKQAIMAQGGRAFISSESYNVQTLASASTARSFNVAFKARSVKGIAWINRLATQNNSDVNSYDASVYYTPTDTYILAAGVRVPPQPINNWPQHLENLQEYFGRPCVGAFAPSACYTSNTIAFANRALLGSFMSGIDLESVRDYLESGADASGTVNFVINQTTTDASSTYTDVCVHFDQVVIFDVMSGQITTSY